MHIYFSYQLNQHRNDHIILNINIMQTYIKLYYFIGNNYNLENILSKCKTVKYQITN